MTDETPTVSPCVFPSCRAVDGNARLTRDVMCSGCRRYYARVLDRIVWNYVTIRATMPRGGNSEDVVITSPSREYGHPAEKASDTAREIARELNETHDGLADHLNSLPPPPPSAREPGRVQSAHRFLTARFNELCTWPAAGDTAESLLELDRTARRLLGLTQTTKHVYLPCPECDLHTLVRDLSGGGDNPVSCKNCGWHVSAELFGVWAERVLDDMVGENTLTNDSVS